MQGLGHEGLEQEAEQVEETGADTDGSQETVPFDWDGGRKEKGTGSR